MKKLFTGTAGAILVLAFSSPLVAMADSETLTYTGTPFDQAICRET